MPLVRMSVVRCRDGCQVQVGELFDQLDSHLATFPGYIMGLYFVSEEHPKVGEIGRLALWDSRESMDKAAQDEHTLALRSQINALLVSGEHEEHVYTVEGTPHNLPSGR